MRGTDRRLAPLGAERNRQPDPDVQRPPARGGQRHGDGDVRLHDRVWGRGSWASEQAAKLAAAVALLALPRKPRHRPARADRAGLTGWLAARAESGGRDDDDVYDVYDDDADADAAEQSERNFA